MITTIHQPSSRLFHKFDKLILLGKGSLLYFGKASEAMDYFSTIGCTPLISMNPAEFLLDLANGNLNDVSVPSELEDKVQIGNSDTETRNGKPSPAIVHEVSKFYDSLRFNLFILLSVSKGMYVSFHFFDNSFVLTFHTSCLRLQHERTFWYIKPVVSDPPKIVHFRILDDLIWRQHHF